jgi:hypothetical protein
MTDAERNTLILEAQRTQEQFILDVLDKQEHNWLLLLGLADARTELDLIREKLNR